MNKTSTFLIHNLWWLIPLSIVLLFWQHTAPILLMLVFAYLGRVILNPAVSVVEKWFGSRWLSVFTLITLLMILLVLLSTSLFPIIKNQITAFQDSISMESLSKFQDDFCPNHLLEKF